MKNWIIGAALASLIIGSAQAETLRLATEGAYAPFNFYNDKQELSGFDVEIGNALCQAAELTCEWTAQEWGGIIPGLVAEKYDAIIASMSITEERKAEVDFTIPYYKSPARFVTATENIPAIQGELKDALADKTIGVQANTIMDRYITDNYADVADIRRYDTQEEANLDLLSSRVDFVFGEAFTMLEFLETDDGQLFAFVGPVISDPKWFGEGIGIAVRKGDDALREKLNAAILKIREDGIYQTINMKYFDFDIYSDN